VIPTETAGPYPADGSVASGQRLNALTLSGIVRSDIRTSVGGASGTALGVPLAVVLTLVNAGSACEVLAGRAVYLWHCTRDGGYSMYSGGHTQENYLRGIQVSDSHGQVTFSTIFPGCYSGRWPHIHFEVYQSLTAATDSSVVSDHGKVSQLALPAIACDQVYGAAAGYSASVANYDSISLGSDNVFGNDSAAHQIATVTGSVDAGYIARLTVGLAI
jgi:protocatechuate 3,4-dioxygenase beta subunit